MANDITLTYPRRGARKRALKERETHTQADMAGQRKDSRHERDTHRLHQGNIETRRKKKTAGKTKKKPVISSSRVTSTYTATVAAEQSSVRAVWQGNKTSTHPRYGTRKRVLKEREPRRQAERQDNERMRGTNGTAESRRRPYE